MRFVSLFFSKIDSNLASEFLRQLREQWKQIKELNSEIIERCKISYEITERALLDAKTGVAEENKKSVNGIEIESQHGTDSGVSSEAESISYSLNKRAEASVKEILNDPQLNNVGKRSALAEDILEKAKLYAAIDAEVMDRIKKINFDETEENEARPIHKKINAETGSVRYFKIIFL